MKIPRYTGSQGSAPIQSGRSLNTGMAGPNALVKGSQELLSTLSNYGAAKVNFEARMRDIELTTLDENAKNASVSLANDFLYELNDRDDYTQWEADYTKKMNALLNKKKKDMDEVAYNMHKANHDFLFAEGLQKVRGQITKRKLFNAQTTYATTKSNTLSTIRTANTPNAVQSAYDNFINTTLNNYQNTKFFTDGQYGKELEEMKNEANSQLMITQSMAMLGEDATIQSPNGGTETNWAAITKALKDPKVKILDIDGNELTVDDPLRGSIIDAMGKKRDDQITVHSKQREENNRLAIDEIAPYIVQVRDGEVPVDANGQPIDVMQIIETDDRLGGNTRITLANNLTTAKTAAKDKTRLHQTPEAEAVRTKVGVMVEANLIDTLEEKSIILNLAMEGYYTRDQLTSELNRIDSAIKKRNQPIFESYKAAVRAITKEVGAGSDITALLSSNQDAPLDAKDAYSMITGMLTGAENKLAYEAVNNLNGILAEGEARGISKYDMLVNKNSPHYVIDDIAAVYKGKAEAAKIDNYEAKAQAYIMGEETDFAGTQFRIDPSAWITYQQNNFPINGSPQINQPPVRNEGETIDAYLNRVLDYNTGTNSSESMGKPKFLLGNAMEADGASSVQVVPE